MKRKHATILFAAVTVVLVGVCAAFGVLNLALSFALVVHLLVAAVVLLCPFVACCKPKAVRVSAFVEVEEGAKTALEVDLVPEKKVRLHYLDNIKSFCTMIVIMHHCLSGFAGGGPLGSRAGLRHRQLP
jgi:membrane protein implicated in regulation of membrane protease activity